VINIFGSVALSGLLGYLRFYPRALPWALVRMFSPNHVQSEVSFPKKASVEYGTKRSVRVDAIVYDQGKPVAIIDCKFGNAPLQQARIDEIRQHLPLDLKGVAIVPIKYMRSALRLGGCS